MGKEKDKVEGEGSYTGSFYFCCRSAPQSWSRRA
jgi:hypothetical protein